MIDDALAEMVVDKYKPEEVLAGVEETLLIAQKLLQRGADDQHVSFQAGLALQELVHVTKVIRALRKKQYGQKTPTIL